MFTGYSDKTVDFFWDIRFNNSREWFHPRKDQFNEYIMTNLRTMWGIQEEKVQLQFPDFSKTVRLKLAPFLENGSVVCQNGRIRLTEKGWLVSDDVFSDLFVV